jgi:hypothetical protein
MIGSILTFIVLCAIFILCAISYSTINKKLLLTDVLTEKQVYYQNIKGLLLAILLLSGVALLIQGYMWLSTTEESTGIKRFEGTEEKCKIPTCSGSENIQISK